MSFSRESKHEDSSMPSNSSLNDLSSYEVKKLKGLNLIDAKPAYNSIEENENTERSEESQDLSDSLNDDDNEFNIWDNSYFDLRNINLDEVNEGESRQQGFYNFFKIRYCQVRDLLGNSLNMKQHQELNIDILWILDSLSLQNLDKIKANTYLKLTQIDSDDNNYQQFQDYYKQVSQRRANIYASSKAHFIENLTYCRKKRNHTWIPPKLHLRQSKVILEDNQHNTSIEHHNLNNQILTSEASETQKDQFKRGTVKSKTQVLNTNGKVDSIMKPIKRTIYDFEFSHPNQNNFSSITNPSTPSSYNTIDSPLKSEEKWSLLTPQVIHNQAKAIDYQKYSSFDSKISESKNSPQQSENRLTKSKFNCISSSAQNSENDSSNNSTINSCIQIEGQQHPKDIASKNKSKFYIKAIKSQDNLVSMDYTSPVSFPTKINDQKNKQKSPGEEPSVIYQIGASNQIIPQSNPLNHKHYKSAAYPSNLSTCQTSVISYNSPQQNKGTTYLPAIKSPIQFIKMLKEEQYPKDIHTPSAKENASFDVNNIPFSNNPTQKNSELYNLSQAQLGSHKYSQSTQLINNKNLMQKSMNLNDYASKNSCQTNQNNFQQNQNSSMLLSSSKYQQSSLSQHSSLTPNNHYPHQLKKLDLFEQQSPKLQKDLNIFMIPSSKTSSPSMSLLNKGVEQIGKNNFGEAAIKNSIFSTYGPQNQIERTQTIAGEDLFRNSPQNSFDLTHSSFSRKQQFQMKCSLQNTLNVESPNQVKSQSKHLSNKVNGTQLSGVKSLDNFNLFTMAQKDSWVKEAEKPYKIEETQDGQLNSYKRGVIGKKTNSCFFAN